MRITDSAVAMSGSSGYSHYQESSSVVTQMSSSKWREYQEKFAKKAEDPAKGNRKDDAAVISISEEAKRRQNRAEEGKMRHDDGRHGSVAKFVREGSEKPGKGKNVNVREWLEEHPVETAHVEPNVRAESKDEQIIRILRRLTEMLRQMRNGGKVRSFSDFRKELNSDEMQMYDRRFENTMKCIGQGMPTGSQGVIDLTGGNVRGSNSIQSAEDRRISRMSEGSLWVRHTRTSSFVMEQENTVFSTTGVARTADGREISFNLDLEMSRGFVGTIESESLETYNYVMTDPLVINLDDSPAGLSDQKFYFDLDSDGKKDEISSLRQGSAFLAYDKNGDGIINDGSELFGTKSGDGFADLAAYDQDGNGWIDEGDDIYSKLKLWTKDEDGNDRLIGLKEADVGAIYLGSAATDFHLNDAANNTNGMIRQTGIFLRESGGVGTVQHVDLAM